MPTDLERNSTHDAHETINRQPMFLGNLAMVLLALAVLFALFVIVAALTHSGT